MEARHKFRVWNNREKRYIQDDKKFHVSLHPNGELICWKEGRKDKYGAIRMLPVKGNVIEWCSGVRDCEGKLIYEGDVLKHKQHGWPLIAKKEKWSNRIGFFEEGDHVSFSDRLIEGYKIIGTLNEERRNND